MKIQCTFWFCRYTYKLGHKLFNGTYIWSQVYKFKSSPYPGQNSLQRVVIFGDMGKVWTLLTELSLYICALLFLLHCLETRFQSKQGNCSLLVFGPSIQKWIMLSSCSYLKFLHSAFPLAVTVEGYIWIVLLPWSTASKFQKLHLTKTGYCLLNYRKRLMAQMCTINTNLVPLTLPSKSLRT